jgi:hypothetical protein
VPARAPLHAAIAALACLGGCAPDYTACESAGECALMTSACCGAPCQAQQADFAAVNEKHMAEFRQESCEGAGECEGEGCAEPVPPRFLATCSDATCQVRDVSTLPITECATAEDCKLRFGLDCCEPCPGEAAQLTAVRGDALEELARLTCAPGERCAGCTHEYPPGVTASCEAGRCAVEH